MLRNVIEGYLDRVKERQLDLPLLLLIQELGFYDVHFVHGPVEFGKDIIAKKRENGEEIQFSFQSKVGDIGQADWRNDIRGQILTALWSALSHPNFDKSLPHQVVLLTTGDLRHNAAIEFQEFNDTLWDQYQKRPVVFWGKRKLTDMLLDHGLNGVYRATAEGFIEFGQFFLLYARALQGGITVREIELYSRQWGKGEVDRDRRLLLSAIETEALAQRCIEHDLVYEAVTLHLARLRLLCELSYTDRIEDLPDMWNRAVEILHTLCGGYIDHVVEAWVVDRDLVTTWFGDIEMTTYPVQCARIMELASLAYFTATNAEDKARYAAFVCDFIQNERGCAHLISDRFVVSLVLSTLVLVDNGRLDEAAALVERTTVWLCDRYEEGLGLPGVEADEQAETNALLGYPFSFVEVPRRHDSLLATALMDLAAFLGDEELYGSVVNDIKACRIYAEYWQAQDTIEACRVEGEDVLHYPAVQFSDNLTAFANLDFAEHIGDDQASFRFAEVFGPFAPVALMALLRDRYFPRLWPTLAPHHDSVDSDIPFLVGRSC